MREWLRLLRSRAIGSGIEACGCARAGWTCRRARAEYMAAPRPGDFSHEVKEAMDGCLACKSCVGQCPIKVDVPASVAIPGGLLRTLSAPGQGLPGGSARSRAAAGGKGAAAGECRHSQPAGPQRSARGLGLVALPELDTIDLQAVSSARRAVGDAVGTRALPETERRKSVVVVQDAFTTHYDSAVVLDFCRAAAAARLPPLAGAVPSERQAAARAWLAQAVRADGGPQCRHAEGTGDTGVSLVGMDPSMTLAYRAEYVKALGRKRSVIALPQEWLAKRLHELDAWRRGRPDMVAAAPLHRADECAARPVGLGQGRPPLRRGPQIVASGCCGMAGLYGHELANRPTSETIYGLSWGPILADARHAGRTLATGYSCRCQVHSSMACS